MKRFAHTLLAVAMTQSMVATSYADLVDLPNPESVEMDLPSLPPPMIEVAPSVITPTRPSNQGLLGRFFGSATVNGITRKTNGLVYRLELKPAVSIRKVTVTADVSQLVLHEAYAVTEAGQRIKIQEFSRSTLVSNMATAESEDLNARERIVAIDLRAESMQAEAVIQVVAYSDEGTTQLSLHKPTQTTPPPPPAPPSRESKISCRWNGSNNQPYNMSKGIFLGKAGHGYNYKETCDALVAATQKAGGFAVCNWFGNGWGIYSTSGSGQIGKHDHGFTDLKSCQRAIIDSANGLLCSWNGETYSPYELARGNNVGKANFGFYNYEACAQNNRTASHGALCNWNGTNYQPYIIRTNAPVGKYDHGFTELKNCQKSLGTARTNFICNWTGEGYARYSLTNPQDIMDGVYRTLETCMTY